MLPMACLGRIKAGGSANNYGLVDYFLSLGLVMLFLVVSARPSLAGKRPRRVLEGAMAVLLVWQAIPAGWGLPVSCTAFLSAGRLPPRPRTKRRLPTRGPSTSRGVPWLP